MGQTNLHYGWKTLCKMTDMNSLRVFRKRGSFVHNLPDRRSDGVEESEQLERVVIKLRVHALCNHNHTLHRTALTDTSFTSAMFTY